MGLGSYIPRPAKISVALRQPRFFLNAYDIIALLIIMSMLSLIGIGAEGMHEPLAKLQATPIDLSLINLPKYALYTTLRMFAAIFASLVFTFLVATAAAKNRKAESIIIPTLDILQSVPVLGFLTFTVPLCMGFFPGNQAGVEVAAIFAVFTAQAWNMAFSFYQSLRTVPHNLQEASAEFCLNKWQTFWSLEVPFAIPGLVWNTMMSMSGSWFFIVASEAISIGNTQINLPGIGSWLAVAVDHKDLKAVCWAAFTMGIVILIYDQIIFRPIVAWADKFSMGQTASQQQPKSWLYEVIKNTTAIAYIMRPLQAIGYAILSLRWPRMLDMFAETKIAKEQIGWFWKFYNLTWFMFVLVVVLIALLVLFHYLYASVSLEEFAYVLLLACLTTLRVFLLVVLASLIWVPIGVWVGLRPAVVAWVQPISQFLAAFPANLLFPIFVVGIVQYNLNPDIWLSPLMILGTQWYIFFNVIAGVTVFPNDLKEAAEIYNVHSWLWWRNVMLPGIFPYYVTGALTATGGSWNASIVAEVVSWGTTHLEAHGLGAYIANATTDGDFHKVVLGVAVMSLFVIFFNKLFWRRLYTYGIQHTGLD